jgi:hypothetical protein
MQSHYDTMEAQLTGQLRLLKAACECQVAWVSLGYILQDSETRRLVAAELKAVENVKLHWRIMQANLQDGKGTLAMAAGPAGPLAACLGILADLKLIFGRFGELYLSMRATCPRLYLVSDAEIAVALMHARSPTDLPQDLLAACLPGVTSLVVSESCTADGAIKIQAVQGIGGDMLTLSSSVDASESPLQEWLCHLEVALRSSLCSATLACLEAAPALNGVLWSGAFPQQAAMLADSIAFVGAVEAALRHVASGSKPDALQRFAEFIAVRLETLSQALSCGGTLSSQQKCVLKGLLLLGQAHRDTAELLLREAAAAPSDWHWLKQARHYWREADRGCHIAVGDAQIAYGWEYQGGAACNEMLLLVQSDRLMLTACSVLGHASVLALRPASETLGVPLKTFSDGMATLFGRLLWDLDCCTTSDSLDIIRAMQACFPPRISELFSENLSFDFGYMP